MILTQHVHTQTHITNTIKDYKQKFNWKIFHFFRIIFLRFFRRILLVRKIFRIRRIYRRIFSTYFSRKKFIFICCNLEFFHIVGDFVRLQIWWCWYQNYKIKQKWEISDEFKNFAYHQNGSGIGKIQSISAWKTIARRVGER